jgi:hypothetical protein
MSLTSTTITGSFARPDGTYSTGYVIARLIEPIANGTQQVDTEPLRGVLTATGKLQNMSEAPFTLVANDDAGTEPVGSTYEFILLIDGQPARTFYAAVSHLAAGHIVDLTELIP